MSDDPYATVKARVYREGVRIGVPRGFWTFWEIYVKANDVERESLRGSVQYLDYLPMLRAIAAAVPEWTAFRIVDVDSKKSQ